MNKLQLNSNTLLLADDWSKCTVSQIKRLASILLGTDIVKLRKRVKELKLEQNPSSLSALLVNTDSYYLRINMLLILMNLKWKFKATLFVLFRMKAEHYAQILTNNPELVDWVMDKPLVKQMLPTVQVGTTNLIGPRDYLGGILFGEFEMIQNRYTAWLKTRNRLHLQQIFNILYRKERQDVPKNSVTYHRDRREALNEITTDKESERLSKIDESIMLVAVLYWQGCLLKLRTDYPHVFTGAKSAGKSNPGELIIALAGSVKPTDIKEAANADIHTVMMKLNKENRDASNNQKPKS